ncbi:hypothetical protein [Microcoleus sp. A006_D1]|uniref:hypothetical protein n=1 Tax=Microcoleus sp. A006_D1 TaxID=3055267 RepID=UPI002FD3A359
MIFTRGDRDRLNFVIDSALPLLLYVAETGRTPNQRWANHDCYQKNGSKAPFF